MAEAEMRVLVLFLALVAGCKESKGPTADTTGSATTSAAPSATAASCGTLGGSCTQEGATCSPAPIGTGWSHMLSCHSGKWTELEIAPLPTPATATASASPQGRTQAAPRSLPKVDVTCNTDADCVITSDEVQDDAPRTYACCPGCTQRAVNAPWYKVFQSACATSPAPMCPPIGCAMPVVKAACKSHRCEIAASKP